MASKVAQSINYHVENLNYDESLDEMEEYLLNQGFTQHSLDGLGDRCLKRTFTSFANADDEYDGFDFLPGGSQSSNSSATFSAKPSETSLTNAALDEIQREFDKFEKKIDEMPNKDEVVMLRPEDFDELQELAEKGRELKAMEQSANSPYAGQSANYSAQIGAGSARVQSANSDDEDYSWVENRAGKRIEMKEEDDE